MVPLAEYRNLFRNKALALGGSLIQREELRVSYWVINK